MVIRRGRVAVEAGIVTGAGLYLAAACSDPLGALEVALGRAAGAAVYLHIGYDNGISTWGISRRLRVAFPVRVVRVAFLAAMAGACVVLVISLRTLMACPVKVMRVPSRAAVARARVVFVVALNALVAKVVIEIRVAFLAAMPFTCRVFRVPGTAGTGTGPRTSGTPDTPGIS